LNVARGIYLGLRGDTLLWLRGKEFVPPDRGRSMLPYVDRGAFPLAPRNLATDVRWRNVGYHSLTH
jgi:hypothetical protein